MATDLLGRLWKQPQPEHCWLSEEEGVLLKEEEADGSSSVAAAAAAAAASTQDEEPEECFFPSSSSSSSSSCSPMFLDHETAVEALGPPFELPIFDDSCPDSCGAEEQLQQDFGGVVNEHQEQLKLLEGEDDNSDVFDSWDAYMKLEAAGDEAAVEGGCHHPGVIVGCVSCVCSYESCFIF